MPHEKILGSEPDAEQAEAPAPEITAKAPALRIVREEFRDAIAEALSDPSEHDIGPLAAILHGALTKERIELSAHEEERLFWWMVAEEASEKILPEVLRDLTLHIGTGGTKKANDEVRKMFLEKIRGLSPSLYRSQGGTALIEFRRRFDRFAGKDAAEFLNQENQASREEEGRKRAEEAERRISAMHSEEKPAHLSVPENYKTPRCTWPIPGEAFIKPGNRLVVESSDGNTEDLQIVGRIQEEKGEGRWIMVANTDLDEPFGIWLADYGMEEYPDRLWNGACRPVRCGGWTNHRVDVKERRRSKEEKGESDAVS
ncbi:MAG TPA: hypothetical protein VNG29_02550 [Candidatus Paceibacterota bacterium]|nr:hypothetical protein [Candidatus Paceibacterota bacterium]